MATSFQNMQILTSYRGMLSHCCMAVPERRWSSLEKSLVAVTTNINMKLFSAVENNDLKLDDLEEKNSYVQ